MVPKANPSKDSTQASISEPGKIRGHWFHPSLTSDPWRVGSHWFHPSLTSELRRIGVIDSTQASLVNQGGLGVIDKSWANSKHNWLEKFTLVWKVSQDSCILVAACMTPRWPWPVRESFPPTIIYSWHNPREETWKSCKFQFFETLICFFNSYDLSSSLQEGTFLLEDITTQQRAFRTFSGI